MIKRRHKLIPVNSVTVDCTPVTARVGREVRTILSCPVDEIAICNVVEAVPFNGTFVPCTFQVPCIVSVPTPPCTEKVAATVIPRCFVPPFC